MRILIAAVVSGMAILNLIWFAATLRATLADAGQDGWGGAAITASAMLGALFLLLITVGAVLAYSIAELRQWRVGIGSERFCVGQRCVEFVPAGNAHHVERVRALASYLDFERAVCGGRCSHSACLVRRHHVGERWVLGL